MIQKHLFRTVILTLFFSQAIFSQNIPPKPTNAIFVNDFADMIGENAEGLLEQKLRSYDDSTSTQIVVVIIESLEGEDLEDYAQKLAETWGIGQKGKDNGILLLISKNDKKIRIQTGYGIEDKIPDGLAKKIIDNDIRPRFKVGQFYSGINRGTDTMIGLLSGSFSPDTLYADTRSIWIGRFFVYIPFLLILAFIYNTGFKKGRYDMLPYAVGIGGGLILTFVLLEAWAYPYKHGFGFWFLTGLADLVALLSYARVHSRKSLISLRYSLIKRSLENEKLWEKLKRFYKPNEVEEAKVEIRTQFLPLRNTFADEERITDLHRKYLEISKVIGNKVFTRRNEYNLLVLADKFEQDKFFEQKIFEKGSLEIAKAKLYEALSYFENKSFDTLSAADRQKLNTEVSYFKKMEKQPEKLLLPDKVWLAKACEDFLNSPKSWVFRPYTSSSIDTTKRKFKKDYRKISANGSPTDYYYFYIHKVKKIQDSPSRFLTKKPTTSSSSSYSSSGSSFSSSSSSSFGGGSFGGGGASGGW